MSLIAISLLLCTAVFLQLCYQALRRDESDGPAPGRRRRLHRLLALPARRRARLGEAPLRRRSTV